MLNKDGQRELCFITKVNKITPIEGADNIELAHVLGWTCITKKGEFKEGDLGVYFEIDSKLPPAKWSEFMEKKHYKVKTMKLGKFKVISQGLLLPADAFGWELSDTGQFAGGEQIIKTNDDKGTCFAEGDFLTKYLNVTYSIEEDNKRKSSGEDKYKRMAGRHPKVFRNPVIKWIYRHKWGKKLLFVFFGKKKDKATSFPTHFQYVRKTDQERCENMPWVLEDKTPFIVTQKCDGSSGTYILERKRFGKFEFYVCSRNVRQLTPDQKSFYDDNYYWECAIKYDIKNKLKDYLQKHPELDYVCWQGEVCAPSIQKNPHKLSETHLYCFHMIDSKQGKYDIRKAAKIWKEYNMEVVPIVDENYILPDDFEEFKLSAEGKYDESVCEGKKDCEREGFVYYKTTDPNFSFKNVSRKYLLKHNG